MWVLICTALAILCIAWINYINMTVARSMERAKRSVYVGVRGKPEAGYFTVPFRIVGDE